MDAFCIFFFICGGDHTVFPFESMNMVNHICRFSSIEGSLEISASDQDSVTDRIYPPHVLRGNDTFQDTGPS